MEFFIVFSGSALSVNCQSVLRIIKKTAIFKPKSQTMKKIMAFYVIRMSSTGNVISWRSVALSPLLLGLLIVIIIQLLNEMTCK